MSRGIRVLLIFGLFAGAYAILNQELLIHAILYRIGAADYRSALISFAGFAFQALALLCATVILPRRWFAGMLALMSISALLNIVYGLIVQDTLDPAKINWLLAEAGQAGAVAGEFNGALVSAVLLTAVVIVLLILARRLARPMFAAPHPLWTGLVAILLPVLIIDLPDQVPAAAERNAYVHLARVLTAPPPPPRAAVPVDPATPPDVDKIVWLIDESVVYSGFRSVIQPSLAALNPMDFGEAHSLGNCSAPSNFALRAGVSVDQVTPTTDLRTTPSIWGYAHKAGFQTTLIDGQTSGPSQNLILAPERALIDQFVPAMDGIETDRKIARRVNAMLKKPGRDFIYVVLRGVHFQYRDHYPAGMIPENSSVALRYATALRFSKRDVFALLLAGVSRERVALFYTSDHGQNVQDDVLPHCNPTPDPSEFAVPLIAFLPPDVGARYATSAKGGRSHGQIFPASLRLMGYDAAEAARYDADLDAPTRRKLWFGRKVMPIESGDTIEVHIGQAGSR
jgi:Sulfatase